MWHIFPNVSNRAAYQSRVFAPLGMRAFLAQHARAFDIAHLHGCHNLPGIFAARALASAGVPWVVSPNGTAPLLPHQTFEKLVVARLGAERVLRGARFVLPVSGVEERQLLALGVPQTSIRRVPNPVDTREFFDAKGSYRFANRRSGAEDAVVLFIGPIAQRGSLDVVLDAFAQFNTTPARLTVVGRDEGGLQAALARAQTLGIGSRVDIVGLMPPDQRLQAMANADVVVYPSADAVFGLPACEALLVGTPVIVGAGSGCAEVVGNCGLAVKPGDVSALTTAIASALRVPVDVRKSRLAGRERILKQYNVRTVTETLDAVYREALGGAERRTA